MSDLTLSNELGSKLRSPPILAGRAPENECIAAVLNDRVRDALTVGTRHLCNRLKSQHGPPADLAQPRQRILEAIDLAESIQLVNDEPQPLVPLPAVHSLEDRDPHPSGNHRPQRRDLARLVGNEKHA